MMTEELQDKTSVNEAQEMIDIVFDLDGAQVPPDYPFELWAEIVRSLVWLKDEKNAGILPLRGSASGENTLLSRRTKLILRIPVERAAQAAKLSGQKIKIGESILKVGVGKTRELLPATTLHSTLVESGLGEVEFLADIMKQLQEMQITCNLICDKYKKIIGAKQSLAGYGLVLHDLKPQASLLIQRTGLGGARHFGCGIFVPFKAISGLE
jgi:CRISPR-associated protein Cas6